MIRTLLLGLLVAASPYVASAADIMINNGFSPPVSTNVIDHATWLADDVHVRNVDCPAGWDEGTAPWPGFYCGTPGNPTTAGPTTVLMEAGGEVDGLEVYDTSVIEMTGGSVEWFYASDSSVVTVAGGTISHFRADGYATVTLGPGVHLMGDDPLIYGRASLSVHGATIGKEIQFKSGGDFDMTDGSIWWLSVEAPGNVSISGGTITRLQALGYASDVLISGGQIEDVIIDNEPKLVMTGGAIEDDLQIDRAGPSIISGGSVGGLVDVDDSDLEVSGGQFSGFWIYGDSTVSFSGGSVSGECVYWNTSTVTITGGTFLGLIDTRGTSSLRITGGSFAAGIDAGYLSTITIEGTGFAVDTGAGFVPVPYGDMSATSGTLMGTLASGEPLLVAFQRTISYPATITLSEFVSPMSVPGLSPIGLAVLASLIAGSGARARRA